MTIVPANDAQGASDVYGSPETLLKIRVRARRDPDVDQARKTNVMDQ